VINFPHFDETNTDDVFLHLVIPRFQKGEAKSANQVDRDSRLFFERGHPDC
jgi:hypothetical protein